MAKVLWCMAETETGVLPFISNNFGDGPGQCGAEKRPGWCLRAQKSLCCLSKGGGAEFLIKPQ